MNTGFSFNKIFSDGMIMQRDEPNIINGTAAPLADVKITVQSDKGEKLAVETRADESGRWNGSIPPFAGSLREYRITAESDGCVKSVDNVLFGDLFHISGQSNMELPLCRTISPFSEPDFTENNFIREFRAEIKCCFDPDAEFDDFCGGEWKIARGSALPEMSGAGYHFARTLFEKYAVPIGLINTSAGGSPIEARMPYSYLKGRKEYDDFLKKCTAAGYMERTAAEDSERERKWYEEIVRKDKISKRLIDGDTEGINLKKCKIPFYFRDFEPLSDFSGRVCFLKSFSINDNISLQSAKLILGNMIDCDRVYVNGVKVGETGYMYPPRIYDVPAGILNREKNTVCICLEVKQQNGGFVEGKSYCLKIGENIIDLSGEWLYAIAARNDHLQPSVFFQGLPLCLYSTMTAPVFGINCKALVWYQGESNVENFHSYKELFVDFVDMYRQKCGKEIPVIFTQLCNFDDYLTPVTGTCWAEMRQKQLECLSIPKTAMAVTADIGEANDLHPINKRDVGKRLALCAEKLIYGENMEGFGILCVSAVNEGAGKIRLLFSENGVILKNTPTDNFEVCSENGESRKAIPAVSEDNTNTVTLTFRSENGFCPSAVRYGWSDNPENLNLFDSYGMPVSPFEIKL